MNNKFKKLISCVALLCAFGVLAACGDNSAESESLNSTSNPQTSESVESTSSVEDVSSVEDSQSEEASSEEGSSVEDSSVEDSSVADSSNSTEDSSEDSSQEPEVKKYTVTWMNDDGTVLATDADVVENALPSYNGATPTKASDAQYNYTFAGWDKEVVAVTENVTYTAIYTSTLREYTVKFIGIDGSVIIENTYHYGDAVEQPDMNTTIESDYFTSTLLGWDSDVVAVTGDATYQAVYETTLKDGVQGNKLSPGQGDAVVLGAGNLGNGANYTKGQQNDDGDENPSFVHQAYLALDGDYAFDDYVAFDFTGKNMPEVAFFANNYNDSMYAEGTDKEGIVVYTGITTWDGQDIATLKADQANGTYINYGFPYMLQDAANGGFTQGAFASSALGRANLVDGTKYRVVMGFVEGSNHGANGITLKWALYNRETNELIEESSMGSWNFFTGSNEQVGYKTLNDLHGSVVLYGKFGTDCTLDKVHGVFEDTTIENVANGLNSDATYTVTFKDANGNVLKTIEGVGFGGTVSYDDALPFPDVADDALFTYSYDWDKAFGPISGDTEYTLTLVSTPKAGIKTNNVTAQGESIVLGASGIGDGANYAKGQNNGGYVRQSYLGLDGNYGLDNYVVFDFTGKNLPEIAFFANNYNDSMYAEGTDKTGIVVVTGITTWNGGLGSSVNGNGTQINYGFPYMIQNATDGAFCEGAFANSALGRANLADDTHYRVIMGFTGSGNKITLHWCLYNLDTNEVVEQSSMTTWGFFSGSNAQVGNMTINDLSGSIVLYGKFGTTCTIDTLYGVESGTFEEVVAEYTTNY